MTGEDLTSATLDANGKSKTYYIGKICDNFAIGGSWANTASTTDTVVITRIDIGYTPK
jgi:hypothetical protein